MRFVKKQVVGGGGGGFWDMFINMVGICFTANFIKNGKYGLKSQIYAQNF